MSSLTIKEEEEEEEEEENNSKDINFISFLPS
jgi:hypothetical protein